MCYLDSAHIWLIYFAILLCVSATDASSSVQSSYAPEKAQVIASGAVAATTSKRSRTSKFASAEEKLKARIATQQRSRLKAKENAHAMMEQYRRNREQGVDDPLLSARVEQKKIRRAERKRISYQKTQAEVKIRRDLINAIDGRPDHPPRRHFSSGSKGLRGNMSAEKIQKLREKEKKRRADLRQKATAVDPTTGLPRDPDAAAKRQWMLAYGRAYARNLKREKANVDKRWSELTSQE